MAVFQESGARGRTRTTDTRIFSPLLYQLSYPGLSIISVGIVRYPSSEMVINGKTHWCVITLASTDITTLQGGVQPQLTK